MKKIERFTNILIGNPDQISSERYFVTISTLVASVFLMILCFFHIFLALQIVPVILAGTSSMLMLGLYYFVRFHSCLIIPKIILTLGGLIMLDFTWYSKFLSNGPVLFFILIFAALVIWVWEGKQLLTLMIFYYFNLTILFYIDYHAPEFLFKYPDIKTRSVDIFLSLFFYSILLIFLLYVFKREFLRQKGNAEKSDKLKSSFLANMSHEIRTPMNGILGFVELLKEPNLSVDTQQNYIDIIEKSGHRMLNIINDIIDVSKIEAGLMKLEIKESNINEQFDYIYTFFKPEVEAKGMELVCRKCLTAKESIVYTDREKVFAILTNLIKNAIKYSQKGAIEFGSIKRNNYIEFKVKDTGVGIPKDRQQAIFERFIQVDNKSVQAQQGAGLGLAITKSYVEMLGGKIWVESEEGIGSTFYFTLPYNPKPEEKSVIRNSVPAQEDTIQPKKLKLLIVEDNEISEMLITINIEKISKEIIKAKNGFEAVEVYRNNPDIDLILMDIQMPVMNGDEATRQIRQINKDVVIIAQTAFGLTGDREKAIEVGYNDYISKPIQKVELLALIQKYFTK